MKRIIIYCSLFVLLLSACSSGGGKYLGEWKPVKPGFYMPSDIILTIEKRDGQFVMTNSKKPDWPIIMTYLDKEDVLTGSIEGRNLTIAFADSTKHLLFKPYSDSDPIEFSKLDK